MKKILTLVQLAALGFALPFTATAQCTRTITQITSGCILYEVSYTTESGKANYDWTFSDSGVITSGDNTNTVTGWFPTAGNHVVTVYYDLPGGCEPAPTVKNVTTPILTPNIPMPKVCTSVTSASLYYSGPSGSAFEYRIDWDSVIADVAPITPMPNPIPLNGLPSTPGIYTGNLYVRQIASSCEEFGIAISVEIIETPTVSGSVIPVCAGTTTSTLSLSVTGVANQYLLSWAPPSMTDVGWTSLPPSSVAGIPTTPGTYYGTLIVRNTLQGCISPSFVVSVTVNPNPDFSLLGAPYFCPGSYTRLSSPAGASYYWEPTGHTGQYIDVSTTGSHRVTMVTNEGCTGTSSWVDVYPASTAGSISINYPGCAPTSLSAGSGYNYSWGSSTTQATYEGYYEVTYTNNYGCQVSANTMVYNCGGGGEEDPGCGQFCPRMAADGTLEYAEDYNYPFGVYPNPASKAILVALSSVAEADCPIEFFDMLGRLSRSEVIEKGNKLKVFQVKDMEAGVYVLTIKDNKRVRQRKLIVTRD